jgi:hypothetical protein
VQDGGAGPAGQADTNDGGGCGCRISRRRPFAPAAFVLALGLFAALLAARRRRS